MRLCLIIVLAFFSVTVQSGFFTGNPDISELKNSNFDKFVKSPGIKMVMFYASWCGHCKNFKPEFEKAAKKIGMQVSFGAVDGDSEKSLLARYSVQGFPTIKVFSQGGKVEDYNGQRTAAAVVKEMMRRFDKLKDPVNTVVLGDGVQKFDNSKNVVVLFSKKDKTPGLFKSLAIDYQASSDIVEFVFSPVTEANTEIAANMYSISFDDLPKIVMIKRDGGQQVFDGEISKKLISKFVQSGLESSDDDL